MLANEYIAEIDIITRIALRESLIFNHLVETSSLKDLENTLILLPFIYPNHYDTADGGVE